MPSRSFLAWPLSVPEARGYVAELLVEGPAELRETAVLLVSELATNAVRHAAAPDFEVSVQYLPVEARLWVGVTDSGSGYPMLRRPPVTAEHGRGLQLVGLLADRWGVRRRRGDDAKTVWFELGGVDGRHRDAAGGREPEPST